jgi:uncharacterized phage protein (TIGR01671 family)
MREILFRGKLAHSGEWATGYLIKSVQGNTYIYPPEVIHSDGHHVLFDSDNAWRVDPETVGEYTGLHDKDGVKIFEGDIVCWKLLSGDIVKGTLEFIRGCFFVVSQHQVLHETNGHFEVIGNIHDSPELLKEGGAE